MGWLTAIGPGGDPIRTATRSVAPLAAQASAAAHSQDRDRRRGQQNGLDRLGVDGPPRRVSITNATNERAPTGRALRHWRGQKASHSVNGQPPRSARQARKSLPAGWRLRTKRWSTITAEAKATGSASLFNVPMHRRYAFSTSCDISAPAANY